MASFLSHSAELAQTAAALIAPGKGILASDESNGTCGKRLATINVENTKENRRLYRELLYKTEGLGKHISGAIMFEEALLSEDDESLGMVGNGKSTEGVSFVDLLKKQGVIPGIKVDKGVVKLPGTDGETDTQGLTNLHKRCAKYYAAGARFAKWRAVLHIKDSGAPTEQAIRLNAHTLARYAIICQANGLVPIVEPEVLMDGTHSIERSAKVTSKVLAATFKALNDHNVMLEGALLKPNMVRPGSDGKKASAEEIAAATVRTLQATVPPALAGVVFLSGGMSEEEATTALNEMNKYGDPKRRPWALSFSFGRALQASVLKAWQGKTENIAAAQEQLRIRSRANGLATLGQYSGDAAGSAAGSDSLHQKNYVY